MAQGTDLGVSAAPELVEKLAQILPDKLRRAATKASRLALERLQPPTDYLPAEPPGSIPQQRIDALQQAIERGDTLRVWYRKTGQHAAECRRLTPLLIEQRGLCLYLIAYCHERRANRTFRLDRLLLETEEGP